MVRSLGQEDPLEEGMATHSSILAWRIPWIESTPEDTVCSIASDLAAAALYKMLSIMSVCVY